MSEEKKKNKIEVDKEFLEEVLKSNTEIQKELKKIKDEPKPLPKITIQNPKIDSLFFSYETITENPKTPQETLLFNARIGEFRQKLLTLMKEYRVAQLTASILKKL